ncbi:SCO4226 family nickel-binding protein [Streptomyces poriticola]|uniref:SCO4226 family nickel-binding protein n=1 Tax=Streptomyces poriticola TaxID=3120506 RepID=UPI002FCDE3C8
MTRYMDVHHDAQGVTADQLRQMHDAAVAMAQEEGVQFEHTWADPESGTVYCLSEAPSSQAVTRIHERIGGGAPDEIHPVPIAV